VADGAAWGVIFLWAREAEAADPLPTLADSGVALPIALAGSKGTHFLRSGIFQHRHYSKVAEPLEARRPNHRTCTLPRSRTVADWPMAASSRSPFLLAARMRTVCCNAVRAVLSAQDSGRRVLSGRCLFGSLSSIVAGKFFRRYPAGPVTPT